MSVKSTLLAGLEQSSAARRTQTRRASPTPPAAKPGAADEARIWLERVTILLDWIAKHPRFVEIRSEAARLLVQYQGGGMAAEAPPESAGEHPSKSASRG
jgi:hypothetical protein